MLHLEINGQVTGEQRRSEKLKISPYDWVHSIHIEKKLESFLPRYAK